MDSKEFKEANPLTLINEIEKTLHRYIPTTSPVKFDFPKLTAGLREKLKETQLTKGPFVQGLPDFEKGNSIEALLDSNSGYLHDGFLNLGTVAERKLHVHQERALEAACKEQKSLIVATGTGSGKTETFLYPIANQLLKDENRQASGVRALIVYPMNALANDQLFFRIAPLFGHLLQEFGITFGRYTGQIKSGTALEYAQREIEENDRIMEALGDPDDLPSNWLLTREQMLNNPPNILVTNYAMLEHLLLLPKNAPLFENSQLDIVVLDEIHTYSGAQATEVAFLLRKLYNKLGIESPKQVFGTSASLSSDENSDSDLIEFASNLLGKKIDQVIRGKRIPHQALSSKDKEFQLSADDWVEAGLILNEVMQEKPNDRVKSWNQLAEDLKDELIIDSESNLEAGLLEVFQNNTEVKQTAKELDHAGTVDFLKLSQSIFPDTDSELSSDALSALLHVGMSAGNSANSFPLIPARYHIAVNGIPGVSLALSSHEDEGWSDLQISQGNRDENGHNLYQLMVCRRCGEPYIECFEEAGHLLPFPASASSANSRRILALRRDFQTITIDEEDELPEEVMEGYKSYSFNPTNGQMNDNSGDNVRLFSAPLVEDTEEMKKYLNQCIACGSKRNNLEREVISGFHPGNEVLSAVICQRVLEELPPKLKSSKTLPMQGRSIITFSDNRQDAAFFAPYFEKSNHDLALRAAAFSVLKNSTRPKSFKELSNAILRFLHDFGEVALQDSNGALIKEEEERKELIRLMLLSEFCSPANRRNSLEAMGLAFIDYNEGVLEGVLKILLSSLNDSIAKKFNQAELMELIRFCLDTMRLEKAITNPEKDRFEDPYIWGDYSQIRAFLSEKAGQNPNTKGFCTKSSRHNRRSNFLVNQLGLFKEEADELLLEIWGAISHKRKGLLKSAERTDGLCIIQEHISVQLGLEKSLYQCKSCAMRQFRNIRNKCTAFNCSGELTQVSEHVREQESTTNHYVHFYHHQAPLLTRAREHTASLSTKLRTEIEEEFAQKQINLLSCTTTMEMGVDLGELEAVVCLNVPPTISNYQQRTGRAGRRAQAAPFCITIAKNTRYDQEVFDKFHEYIEDEPSTPFIHLANQQLFLRHQFSILLRYFIANRFESNETKIINSPKLGDLFKGGSQVPIKPEDFRNLILHWFENSESGKEALIEAEGLCDLLPDYCSHIGCRGEILKAKFITRINELCHEVYKRWELYENRMKDIEEGEKTPNQRRQAARWEGIREQFLNQPLVSKLSERSLIPTYSFPIHSLNLDVIQETKKHLNTELSISLNRDAALGISEYAPGAEVVANGRIWASEGIAEYPREFMPEQYFCSCKACGHVDISDVREEVPSACTNCSDSKNRKIYKFIEPKGFVTAYSKRKGKSPKQFRRKVKPADEAKLITTPSSQLFKETSSPFIGSCLLTSSTNEDAIAPPGKLFIVNKGPKGLGFLQCPWCNYSKPIQNSEELKKGLGSHTRPETGLKCDYDRNAVQLHFAHTFYTDVRILRLRKALPNNYNPIDDPNFEERFLTTISEAIRIASAKTIGIDLRELRATSKRSGGLTDIILYDSVPGGAGYCQRLLSAKYPLQKVLENCLEVLECPDDCERGCRRCLCDYSNSRNWDSFDRKIAIPYLKDLLSNTEDEEGSLSLVEHPNFNLIREKAINAGKLTLIARRLFDQDQEEESELRFLIDLMQNKVVIDAYLQFIPRLKNLDEGQLVRSQISYLLPYVEQGKLRLHTFVPDELGFRLEELPRALFQVQINEQAFFSPSSSIPLLEKILCSPLYDRLLNEFDLSNLEKLKESATAFGIKYWKKHSPKITKFKPGEKRDVKEIFSDYNERKGIKLVIRDPYCGVGSSQIQILDNFVKTIASNMQLKSIQVVTKGQDPNRKNSSVYMDDDSLRESIKRRLKSYLRDGEVKVKVKDFYNSKGKFHDRSVLLAGVDDEGCDDKSFYDLSGGLDYLMDENKETAVYQYKE